MSKLITNDCVSSLVNNHIGKTDISDIGENGWTDWYIVNSTVATS